MKIFKILLTLCIFITGSCCYAYQYTEAQKNQYYDEFLKGYFLGIDLTLKNIPNIPQDKKARIISRFKASISKTDLINSSWACLQNYPPQTMNQGVVVCVTPWNEKQMKNLEKIMIEEMQK